jgi:FtsP/CotA-like multicopper oxidase with cupredoxin domain
MLSRRDFIKSSLIGGALLAGPLAKPANVFGVKPGPAVTINPKSIPKYVTQLVIPPVHAPTGPNTYTIGVTQFMQQMLPPGLPQTTLWGYQGPVVGGPTNFVHSPSATFEATRGVPIQVQWRNNLYGVSHLLPVDPTIHWANPLGMIAAAPFNAYPPGYAQAQSPVPIVTHLHGGEVPSVSDGGPQEWFTPGETITGPDFVTSLYDYPNGQLPTTLWYHDHALGMTRLNVVAGLAGFYLLRGSTNPIDPNYDPIAAILPSGPYEVPLAIQDRTFNIDGSLSFPAVGVNPGLHPYWMPEFFGDSIIVNGHTWPNLNVDRGEYRVRLLNGCSARVMELSLSNKQSFKQIGSDGGYMPAPAVLQTLRLAPGERADILIDFSAVPAGTKIVLTNTAKAPFPNGTPADPQTVGQIMQFTVTAAAGLAPANLAGVTWPAMPVLTPQATRTLTLHEQMGPAGPLALFINGQMYDAPVSENPRVGSTEMWEVVNLTGDTHPIHLHLVQFQLMNRQAFQTGKYAAAWAAANGAMLPLGMGQPTVPVPVAGYLQGKPTLPLAYETGWKDTVQMNPGEVTRIVTRWAPQDAPATVTPGTNAFPFDPTAGQGYVYHCHIIDHEDNEMMRPYKVSP